MLSNIVRVWHKTTKDINQPIKGDIELYNVHNRPFPPTLAKAAVCAMSIKVFKELIIIFKAHQKCVV